MLKKIENYIKDNNLISENDRIILGVSGGADSVCLFLVLLEMKKIIPLELNVVHINHGIRGEEASEDSNFVEKLCSENGICCQVFKFDVTNIAKQRGISVEEAGRDVRYETFQKVAKEKNAGKIAVAHNLNDNAETILLSLFRGTGIKGLTGIKAKRNNIIRPLLCVERRNIEDYLNEKQVSYRTDSTNAQDVYARNKIRNSVLPEVVKSINSAAVSHIVSAGASLEEIENYLESQTLKVYNGNVIEISEFVELDIVIKKRIIRKAIEETAGKLKDITATHIEDVLSLCKKEVGKYITLPYGLRAIRTYDEIVIEEATSKEDKLGILLDLEQEGEYEIPYLMGKIKLSYIDNNQNLKIEENMYTKCFDYDKIKDTLHLRTRKEGDIIQINPNGNTKKIKSYFIDEKIPSKERDNVLLVARDNHVLWVIGHRKSEAFRVTKDTKKIIRLEYYRGQNER